MKFILILIASLFGSTMFITEKIVDAVDPPSDDIVVVVKDIIPNKGEVYVGLFDSKNTFRKINQVFQYESLDANKEALKIVLEDVPHDEYAVVVFQDFNGNQKFDKNMLGFPKEPFGFSTNFKVSTKAPQYREVTFEHKEGETELKINLQQF